MVQRLCSMFPAGAAGWGLLLLRLCAAGMLFRNCILDATVSVPTWEIAGVVILAGAFLLGRLPQSVVAFPLCCRPLCCFAPTSQILCILPSHSVSPRLFSLWDPERFRLILVYLAVDSLFTQIPKQATSVLNTATALSQGPRLRHWAQQTKARVVWPERVISVVLYLGLCTSAEAFSVDIKTLWPVGGSNGDRSFSNL